MHNLDNKKELHLQWYHCLLGLILSFAIYASMVLFISFCFKTEEAEAYTNDVVPYADEQISDLTGTTWVFNDLVSSFSGDIIYLNFDCNGESFNSISFVENLNDDTMNMETQMFFDSTPVSPISINSIVNMYQDFKIITISGGSDVTDLDFTILWLQDNAVLQTPQVQEYTISSNLINTNSNISLPLTITENDIISFEFTPIENNIFNTYQWTITPLNSYSLTNLVEEPFKISFDISNVTSDLTIDIEAIPYISLKGQWVLKDFNQMTITPTNILENVNFSSNGYSYNNISALGGDYLRYYSDDLVVNVLSLLDNGLTSSPLAYLPTTTYNYNLITINSDYYGIFTNDTNLPSYLRNVTYFTEIFRPATQNDLDNIIYKNGQISILSDEYTFVNLFGALIDAPITALKGLLNFTFFGVNLFSFLSLFVTLAVVYLCIKMLKGGRNDE